jgi:hypothetical protein
MEGESMAGTAQAPKPEQAQDKAQEVAAQAREKAQEAMGETRSRVSEQVDQRSTQAGERVKSTASDLRSVGEELRKQGKDGPGRMADQAADRVERVAGYLTDADGDRMLRDLEDFGRRQPLALLAGGFLLGVAASRFLKASSTRRYESRSAHSNGAHAPEHAQRTITALEAASDVQPAVPDSGEHHQRFEGHS